MTPHPAHVPVRHSGGRFAQPSRGVALLVVLMLLLAITGIALYSARYAVVGESSSRNQMDNEIARQAAEAALRDAERDLNLTANVPGARCTRPNLGVARFTPEYFYEGLPCPQGQCALPLASEPRKWGDLTKGESWWPAARGGLWNDNVADKPGALCDFLGGVPLGTYTGAAPLVGVAIQPEYLLELGFLYSSGQIFARITARGFGLTPETQVVLQSYFRLK